MRIKSYFAPSVQAAIALARKEFNDDVTLVTSHAASHDGRHLGEYEVVFAVDEESPEAAQPEEIIPAKIVPAAPAPPAFQALLEEAVAARPSTEEHLAEKLQQLRSAFIELGIEPPMARALLTIVERCVPAFAPLSPMAAELPKETVSIPVAAPPPSVWAKPALPSPPAAVAKAQYTAAELAFVLSVSELPAGAPVSELPLKAQTANR